MEAAPFNWPLFGLRLACREVRLQPVREADLPALAAILPDDYEHDPSAEMLADLSLTENRLRLLWQGVWRSYGTWSVSSWSLDFRVEHEGRTVGVQSLEAERFLQLRTVDSGSWLVPDVRGRGVGTAMRTAVLAFAFDHLGALAAISSARKDNLASLGVSRRVGYEDNGLSLNQSPTGLVELQHVRLTKERWDASGLSATVTTDGVAPCLPYFGLPSGG